MIAVSASMSKPTENDPEFGHQESHDPEFSQSGTSFFVLHPINRADGNYSYVTVKFGCKSRFCGLPDNETSWTYAHLSPLSSSV